jgi:hypothetical protein
MLPRCPRHGGALCRMSTYLAGKTTKELRTVTGHSAALSVVNTHRLPAETFFALDFWMRIMYTLSKLTEKKAAG